MDSNNINERRKYPRFQMDLPLAYRVLNASQAHGGLVINASESGLLVRSVRDMPVGTKLNIEVLFPQGFELTNFEVSAEIVWKDSYWQENRQEYEFGLKFINILDGQYHKLKNLIEEGR